MKNKGFTIVESLIAITILVLAVTGVTSAIQTSLSSYIFSKNQVIAFYLAQEGFEQIRNLRDENKLKNQPWLTGISANSGDPCYFGNACYFSLALGTPLTSCPGGTCPVLKQNASGYFGYDSAWTDTIFRRTVLLTSTNSDEISVQVTVNWSKGIVNRQFSAREIIFNWR